jgi:hypothetical protein
LIREGEMKVAGDLGPLPGTPCYGRHFLDDSYLIQ